MPSRGRTSKSLRGGGLPASFEAGQTAVQEDPAAGVQSGAARGRVGEVKLVGGQGQAADADHCVAQPERPGVAQAAGENEVELAEHGDRRALRADQVAEKERAATRVGKVGDLLLL